MEIKRLNRDFLIWRGRIHWSLVQATRTFLRVYSAAFLPAGILGGTLTVYCVLMELTKVEASSLSKDESQGGGAGEGTRDGGSSGGGKLREDIAPSAKSESWK